MVDAGHHGVDLAHVGVEDETEPELEPHQFVAEPDRANRGLRADGPAQSGEGVAHVDQGRIGGPALDLGGDGDHDRDAAQRTGDATGTDRVTHRLPDPVAGRDLDVVGHGGQTAHGEGGDHDVGPLEGRTQIGGGGDVHADGAARWRCALRW